MTVRVKETETGTIVEWVGASEPPSFVTVDPKTPITDGPVVLTEGVTVEGRTFMAERATAPRKGPSTRKGGRS
jgi:hypothetical protein